MRAFLELELDWDEPGCSTSDETDLRQRQITISAKNAVATHLKAATHLKGVHFREPMRGFIVWRRVRVLCIRHNFYSHRCLQLKDFRNSTIQTAAEPDFRRITRVGVQSCRSALLPGELPSRAALWR